jgi:hypothetical protein
VTLIFLTKDLYKTFYHSNKQFLHSLKVPHFLCNFRGTVTLSNGFLLAKWKCILTIVLVIFLLLLSAELAARVIYRYANKFPQITGGIQFVEFLRRRSESFTGPIESRPYTLYWNRPNYSRKGFQQNDSNGFRFKGYDVSLTKTSKRILCYGGSTTYSDHVLKNPQECWPHLLETSLRASGKPFEVVNCGLNYGLTPELLSHLIFEGLHFAPDIVILHGPGNDSLPIAVGDNSFDYRNTRSSTNLYPRFFEPVLLNMSAVVRLIYARMMRESTPVKLEPNTWPDSKLQNDRMTNSQLEAFKSNVKTFVDVCISRGIKVVLVDFVQNHVEQLELLRPGMSTGMISIVEKMNSYFEEVSIRNPKKVLHVRLDSNDFEVGDFVDLCHLNKVGETKKAELIFKQVSEFVKI